MTNLTHIFETAVLVLATYLLGCAIGYAVRRILHAGRGTRTVSAAVAPVTVGAAEQAMRPRRDLTTAARLAGAGADDPAPRKIVAVNNDAGKATPQRNKKAPTVGPKPVSIAAPRLGGADNLKKIKGIGPKIEASLNELGIYHFDQIAAWSKSNADWVDRQLAFKGRIKRERWVEQAAAFVASTRLSA